MSVQELYAAHPKPWTNVHCYSLTTDNLKVNHVQGADSALLRVPVYTNLPAVPDAGHFGYHNSELYYSDGSAWVKTNGDVTGPASSTDNAIVRFNGTDGEDIQNSGVILNDTNDISGINDLRTTRLTFDGTNFMSTLAPPYCMSELVTPISFVDSAYANLDAPNTWLFPGRGSMAASLGANGIFTAPRNGIYHISAFITFDANATGIRSLAIWSDGADALLLPNNRISNNSSPGSIAIPGYVSSSAIVSLLTNQKILLQVFQNSGGNLNITSACIMITQIGYGQV